MRAMPLFILVAVLLPQRSAPSAYNDLVLHLVPHSHCSPAWLRTMAGYRSTVDGILTSVSNVLSVDPSRRFVWAEIALFQRWYATQPKRVKDRVRDLVDRGQLEFVGGGWTQLDEALPRIETALDALTLGHAWLHDTFGVRPRVGWQIGAFGHSAVTPRLLLEAGYDALVINRVHHRVKQQLRGTQGLEFVWEGLWTHVLSDHYSIPEGFDFESKGVRQVTHPRRRAERLIKALQQRAPHFRTHHVLVPFGDDFRFQQAEKQFTNMDKLVNYVNEKIQGVSMRYSTASEYVEEVRRAASITSLRFPSRAGDFFPYADNADSYWTGYYSTLPRLKAAFRTLESRVRSASALYALARAATAPTGLAPPIAAVERGRVVPDRTDRARVMWGDVYAALQRARSEAALMGNVNAVTGTSRSDVIKDYEQRIATATQGAESVVVAALEQLLVGQAGVRPSLTHAPFELALRGGATEASTSHPIIFHSSYSSRRVELAQIRLRAPWSVARHVRVVDANNRAVPTQVHQTIVFPQDKQQEVPSRGQENVEPHQGTSTSHHATEIVLSFVVDVPALGYSTYFVSTTSARQRVQHTRLANAATPVARLYEFHDGQLAKNVAIATRRRDGRQDSRSGRLGGGGGGGGDDAMETKREEGLLRMDTMANGDDRTVVLGNALLSVELEASTGLLRSVTDKQSGRVTMLRERFMQYVSHESGAYLFRPDYAVPSSVSLGSRVSVLVVDGPLASEVTVLGDEMARTLRLCTLPGGRAASRGGGDETAGLSEHSYSDSELSWLQSFFDIDYTVRAAPDTDLVVRYETDMGASDSFFTDNALGELVQRPVRRPDTPVASSIFPANAAVALRDNKPTAVNRMGQEITVLLRQPMAASSPLTDGGGAALELTLHRNHRLDDGRGLSEGLNDFSIATVLTRVSVGTPEIADRRRTESLHRFLHPMAPVFADESPFDSSDETFGGSALPTISALLTYEAWTSQFTGRRSFLRAGLPRGFEILSLVPRDWSSDDIVLRLRYGQHSIEAENPLGIATLEHSQIFSSDLLVSAVRGRTLAMSSSESRAQDRARAAFSSDSRLELNQEVADVATLSGGRQNLDSRISGRDETGVFLSEHALGDAGFGFEGSGRGDPYFGGRRLLSLRPVEPQPPLTFAGRGVPFRPRLGGEISFSAGQIRSYYVSIVCLPASQRERLGDTVDNAAFDAIGSGGVGFGVQPGERDDSRHAPDVLLAASDLPSQRRQPLLRPHQPALESVESDRRVNSRSEERPEHGTARARGEQHRTAGNALAATKGRVSDSDIAAATVGAVIGAGHGVKEARTHSHSHSAVRIESLRVEIAALKHKVTIQESRLQRQEGNVEELLEELKLFGDFDDSDDKRSVVDELEKAKRDFETVEGALLSNRENLAALEAELATYLAHSPVFDANARYKPQTWRDPSENGRDAALHGVIAGAGGMLIVVIALQWIFQSRKRRSFVPVSYAYGDGYSVPVLPMSIKRL